MRFIGKGVLELSQFLKAFNGQPFEIQMNQRSHDGNKTFKWTRGALFTAKDKDLWQPHAGVTEEDICHIQSRVELFRCIGKIKRRPGGIPQCRFCFARWVCQSAAQYDTSQALAAPHPDGMSVSGLESLLLVAKIPKSLFVDIQSEVSDLGAVHVRELRQEDWQKLPPWKNLREMERRRLLAELS